MRIKKTLAMVYKAKLLTAIAGNVMVNSVKNRIDKSSSNSGLVCYIHFHATCLWKRHKSISSYELNGRTNFGGNQFNRRKTLNS